MSRQDAQGYVQDLIAFNESRKGKPGKRQESPVPMPVRLPAKPPVRR